MRSAMMTMMEERGVSNEGSAHSVCSVGLVNTIQLIPHLFLLLQLIRG